QLNFTDSQRRAIRERALQLVDIMREKSHVGVESFLQEYRLDQKEGVLIMCLAEALLRIPDTETADRLIEDKFSEAEWKKHIGGSDSFLVNASAWGLMLTGKLVKFEQNDPRGLFGKLVQKSGKPM